MSDLVSVFGTIALSVGFFKLLELVAKRRAGGGAAAPRRPQSRGDWLAQVCLVGAAASFASFGFLSRDPNLLTALGLGTDRGPQTMLDLSLRFQSHMRQRFPGWPAAYAAGHDAEPGPAVDKVRAVEQLFDRLRKSEAARNEYDHCGHAAFTSCGWCAEHGDYAAVALPPIVAQYGAVLLVIYAASVLSHRKLPLCKQALYLVIFVAFADCFALFSSQLSLSRTALKGYLMIVDSQFNQLHLLRNLVFAAFAAYGYFVGLDETLTDAEIVASIAYKAHQNVFLLEKTILLNDRVLSDPQTGQILVQARVDQAQRRTAEALAAAVAALETEVQQGSAPGIESASSSGLESDSDDAEETPLEKKTK
ncbi:hypothetical protein HK105_203006 [Polyrhizophydium stewartii]|uniref:Uncharacterized protein n=1 Tax=Polyrhizophydium stewartii TaxID=2732419 RepID=A0ABR4NCU5_9FUNG|nr:hypothetical protein HK105_006499 [Polyrhizophydium stewartii]